VEARRSRGGRASRRWSRQLLVQLALIAFVWTFGDTFASEPARTNEGSGTEAEAGEWRQVTRVIDGDTLVLDGGERVRLIGVDTPETVHPQKPVEYFGKEASAFTRRTVEAALREVGE
jgi:micrococcal nuclease